jgi:hypothetical protein
MFVSGVIGNILNILTFSQLKLFRGNRWAFYLTVESISSCLYQFNYAAVTILTIIYGDDGTGRFPSWCKLRYLLAASFALTSSYTICFAAIDQFCSTNYRLNLRQLFTLKVTYYITFVSVCFWLGHGILFGLFFEIHPQFGCIILNSIFLHYTTSFFYPVLGGILPIVVSSLFAILAYRNVRRIVRRQIPIARRRLDQQMTAMILTRVVLLVFLQSPYNVYRIVLYLNPLSTTDPIKYAIGRLIQAVFLSIVNLNYTVNLFFFI